MNDGDDDDREKHRAVKMLRSCWLLFSLMQMTNSLVFTYDGLLLATQQFRFVRNMFLIGTIGLFTPALVTGFCLSKTLFAIWCAKAALNSWRCLASVGHINLVLPRSWDPTKFSRWTPTGPGPQQGPDGRPSAGEANADRTEAGGGSIHVAKRAADIGDDGTQGSESHHGPSPRPSHGDSSHTTSPRPSASRLVHRQSV
mmetsp:Transcript_14475/g.25340  ORF Transcript_14475/g.25340 Transcript_14475/m.25340 type:complete len:199 (-) Transcript_14475:49-645(-)